MAAETFHTPVFVGLLGFSLELEEKVTGSLLSLGWLERGPLQHAGGRSLFG